MVLLIPIWTNATKAAEDRFEAAWWVDGHPNLVELGAVHSPATPTGDKDCVGDFDTRAEAQRFLVEHGPKADRHHLDSDRDGKACEEYFSR